MNAVSPTLPAEETGSPARRVPFLGFVTDAASEAAIREGLAECLPALELRQATLPQATALLQKLPSPEMLLIDLEGIDEPLPALRLLAEAVEPTTRVFAVGTRTDVNFYRALTRDLGISEYLYKPLAPDMVARLFAPTSARRSAGTLQGGRVVSVTGAGGGLGATTVAANLAWYLGETLARHTVLVDPDLHTGGAALLFGGGPSQGLRTALEAPDRLDELLIQRAAQPIGGRLALLAADEPLDPPVQVAPGAGPALLDALRRRYNFVVADVPAWPLPLHRDLLAGAHQRVIVLEPTLASARNALRLLALPQGAGQVRRAVLVLNRLGAPGTLPRARIEEALDAAIDVAIPWLPRPLGHAATYGTPAAGTRGAFRTAIQRLAREVAFTGEPAPARRFRLPWTRA